MNVILTFIGVVLLLLWSATYRMSATERAMDGSVLCDRHGHAVVVSVDWTNQVQLYHLPGLQMSCPRAKAQAAPTQDIPTPGFDFRKSPFPPRATVPPYRMQPPNVSYDPPPRQRGA